MADNLTTLSLLTLAQTFRGDIVDQINRSVQFLKTVPIKQGAGKNVAWAPEKDGELVENYSEGADAVNFGSTTQASAILTWALYRANPHVTQLAMDAAATSFDPLGNKQQWGHQISRHAAGLAMQINKDCFGGDGTGTKIAGLDVAIATASNTYATIDRSSGANSYFRPTVVDPGTPTAPVFADIRDDVRQVYEASGENPDVCFCTPTIFNYIGSLFDATRRNVTDAIRTARGMVQLDMGFQALELDGLMFVKERHATSARMYYVNTNGLHLEVLPTAEQRMLEQAGVFIQANDGYGAVPLSFHYEPLAKTGASEKAQILSTSQLVVERPNAHATRLNVATS